MDQDLTNNRFNFVQSVKAPAFQYGTSYGVTSTGTTLGTALALTQSHTYVSSGAASSGVALPANASHIGEEWIVWNQTGNSIIVYAASGETIGGAAS